MSNQYNNDSLLSLDDITALRMRPASVGIENHEHTLKEILANSIDEAREGFGSIIRVIKHKDRSITVKDEARGVPMGLNSKGEYAYEIVFATMYGGGKYHNDGENSQYQYSLGTNGLGCTATNFTADFMNVISCRENKRFTVGYEKGVLTQPLEVEEAPRVRTGTSITWRPSKEVFGDDNIRPSFIKEVLKQQAIVNKGIRFVFKDEITEESVEFYYEEGIADYIKELSEEKNFSNIICFDVETMLEASPKNFKTKGEFYFAFNNHVNHIQYFHNSSNLENGGSPDVILKNGFTYMIDKYLKTNNLYKKNEKKITYEDVKDSLIAITNTFSNISLYTDQAKKQIRSKEMEVFFTEWLRDKLEIYFIENPMEASKIGEQILTNKRARESAEKTRTNIRKKLETKMKGLQKIDGLNDCDKNAPFEDKEIWLGEGVSATSTLTDARNPDTMATFPLGGRFINALKCNVEDVLKNGPALGIIHALGCGVAIPKEEKKKFKDIQLFDRSRLRYGKVIIATDMDAFGHGIALSLIAFFYKFMPQLLQENRIYLSISPRYEMRYKDELYFAYSEADKERVVADLNKKGKKNHTVSIVKGLGELDKDIFWNFVMNPENRILKQLSFDDVNLEELEHYMGVLIGEDITGRKQYVRENIVDANLEEID